MSQDREYEVEIVDDQSNYLDDPAPGAATSPEDKAAEQAKAEQDSGAQPLSGKQRRSKLKERIDELTRKYRDEERNRYAIERERDDEREQFQQHQRSFQQEQDNSARIVFSTLKDNKQLLESHLETARNKGDTKTEYQIQDRLTEVRESMGRLKQHYPRVESGDTQEQPQGTGRMQPQGQQRAPQTQEPAPQQPQQAKVPDAAKQWIDSNSWLKGRADLHATINAFDAALKAQGKDPATPEFYVELTKKLKAELPEDLGKKLAAGDNDDLDDLLGPDDDDDDDLGDGQPAAPAAPAANEQRPANSGVSEGGRATPRPAGKRMVKLSRDEQAMAQRLGISNEAYAKQKVRSESNTGYQYID
jgi:hypothetical protein